MPLPNDITDLYLRLTASTVSATDGSPISSWNNEQGSHLTFEQSDPSKQPSYVSDAFNGNPAIRFKGSSWLGTADLANLSRRPYTVLIAIRPTGTGLQSILRSGGFNDHQPDLDYYFDATENTVRPVVVHNSPDARSFAFSKEYQPSFADDPHVLAFTVPNRKESDTQFYFDGKLVGTTSGTRKDNMFLDVDGPLSLGMGHSEIGNLRGDVFEVLIYQKALSNADILKLWHHYKNTYAIEDSEVKRVLNLNSWFEAEDLGASESDPVSVWKDRLNKLTLLENRASKQPHYSEDNASSIPSIRFDRGTSLSASFSSLQNDEFAALMLYRRRDNERQEFFRLKYDPTPASLESSSLKASSTLSAKPIASRKGSSALKATASLGPNSRMYSRATMGATPKMNLEASTSLTASGATLGITDFKFKSHPTHSLERLEISNMGNAAQLSAPNVPAVTDEFHSVGASLRGENEDGTLFFVKGEKFETEQIKGKEGNALPDNVSEFTLGKRLEADVTSLIVVKGRIRDKDVDYIESHWQGKYLKQKRGRISLYGTSKMRFPYADSTITSSASLLSDGITYYAGDATLIAEGVTLGAASHIQSSISLLNSEATAVFDSHLSLGGQALLSSNVVTFLAQGTKVKSDTVSTSAQATLGVGAVLVKGIEASLTSQGEFVGNASSVNTNFISLSSQAVLISDPKLSNSGQASLSASGATLGTSSQLQSTSSLISAQATISAVSGLEKESSVSLTSTGTALAEASILSFYSAFFPGQATLTADTVLEKGGETSLTSSATTVSTAFKIISDSPSLSAQATSAYSSSLDGSLASSLNGQALITATAGANQNHSSTLSSVGQLSAVGEVEPVTSPSNEIEGSALLSGDALLDATTDEGFATINTLHNRDAGI